MRLLTILSLAVVVSTPVGAQGDIPPTEPTLDSLARGAEVRVWSKSPELRGWKLLYIGATDTSVVLGQRFGSAPIKDFRNEIAMASITQLEVRRGRNGLGNSVVKNAAKGALLGTAIALVGGFMLGSMAEGGDGGEAFYLPIAAAPWGAMIGGTIGGMTGVGGTTVWVPVRLPR